ncbi:hypothetical protein UlMin_039799 [Ulmus minor]
METPSSTRRVTRSQALAAIPATRKSDDIEKGLSNSRPRTGKSQQQDRSALFDITNDSPIVGLAMGNLQTPLSSIVKQKSSLAKKTPGSGEDLLRGQVKNLLQKVEEEAELSKLSLESRPFVHLKGIVISPAGLLAPTPANTPQVLNLSDDGNSIPNNPSPIVEEQLIPLIVDGENQNSLESQKSILTRSLLLDFSEKFDSSESSDCSSVLTFSSGENVVKEKPTPDDDNASIWSVQVNASTNGEDEDEVVDEEEEEEEEEDYYYEEEEEDDEMMTELCDCISKISMNEKPLPKFEGKHTRFVYNSEDEIQGEDEEGSGGASPSVVRLKGLPTPKGKHLRFAED